MFKWGESAGQPPQTGKSFRFVRACVRATDARFPILCRFSSKSVSRPPYLLSFGVAGFLFVRGGGPSCSNLDFSPWLVSFTFGDLILWFLEFLEESS